MRARVLDIEDAEVIVEHRECLRCGACCKGMIIHIDSDDLTREPELAEHLLGIPKRDPERGEIRCLETWPRCSFLTETNECSIYETRPRECREFPPGCRSCVDATAHKRVAELEARIERMRPVCELAALREGAGDVAIAGAWRCSCCGELHDDASDPSWRWNGNIWEHKCPGASPQCGHQPARYFGPAKAALPQAAGEGKETANG